MRLRVGVNRESAREDTVSDIPIKKLGMYPRQLEGNIHEMCVTTKK